MNAIEANVLLTEAALVDPRVVPDPDRAELWAEILADVPFQAGRDALRKFWRTSPGVYPQPGHILELADVPKPDEYSKWRDTTVEILAESKARALEAAGVTEEEFEAHKDDVAWVRSRFTKQLEGGEAE